MPAEITSSKPIVVCGDDGLAARIVEELAAAHEPVVLLCSGEQTRAAQIASGLDVEVRVGDFRDLRALGAAGVAGARALALVAADDLVNLHAALAAQELNPHVRLVMRAFNVELGHRLEALFTDCRTLSASELAAPAFCQAVLHGYSGHSLDLHGRTLTVAELADGDPRLVMSLARWDSPVLRVQREARGTVLALAEGEPDPPAPRKRTPIRRRLGGLRPLTADRRVRVLLAAAGALTLFSALVFTLFFDLSPIDALYFTVTTITTTGYGDINLLEASTPLKLYGMAVMIFGALVVALLFALITDWIVGVRLAEALGEADLPERDHVVVCGAGSVGVRIVEQLTAAGVACAAIERHPDGPRLPVVRRLGVPLMIADPSQPQVLERLRLGRARALAAVTDDDLANLEIALRAREINPELRIVLRMFDQDLARRVDAAFDIHLSRSLGDLAAPAFVAALLGRRVLGIVPVGITSLPLVELPVSRAAAPVGELARRFEVEIMALDGRWRPSDETCPAAGQTLVALGPRRCVGALAAELA